MSDSQPAFSGPHFRQPVRIAGEPIQRARAAVLMVHGRGARAEDILSLSDQINQKGFAYFAPQAAHNSWYPDRFLAPIPRNEPWLSSALDFLKHVLSQILEAGVPPERTMLLGFSQGACLVLEFAARNARRYGGVVGLSGALIGPHDLQRDYTGSLAGTPVFLGCSDVDFHIPKERVQHTAEELRCLGSDLTMRLYPNMGHTINQDELDHVRKMMQTLVSGS
jgi:phospholipase/carboxylesterase